VRKICLAVFILLAAVLFVLPAGASAQVSVGISVRIGPPAIPVYPQPVCPGPGYLWTPGFWAYGPAGYYWVPGTWVVAPAPGLLWTPGYWGYGGGVYAWHAGYWGPHVGFYGGINYGFGYYGAGFVGGEWRGRVFAYNAAVLNVNTTVVHNYYINRTVINNVHVNRVSYNGGPGGIDARPTPGQLAAERERRYGMTDAQSQHELAARNNPQLRDSYNHGRPEIAATSRPGEFTGHGVVGARPENSSFRPPAEHTQPGHPNNSQWHSFNPPNHGNNSRPEETRSFNPPHGGQNPSSRPSNSYDTNHHANSGGEPHGEPHNNVRGHNQPPPERAAHDTHGQEPHDHSGSGRGR